MAHQPGERWVEKDVTYDRQGQHRYQTCRIVRQCEGTVQLQVIGQGDDPLGFRQRQTFTLPLSTLVDQFELADYTPFCPFYLLFGVGLPREVLDSMEQEEGTSDLSLGRRIFSPEDWMDLVRHASPSILDGLLSAVRVNPRRSQTQFIAYSARVDESASVRLESWAQEKGIDLRLLAQGVDLRPLALDSR